MINVSKKKQFFCKFITGNETGTTGSHQAGFYIPRDSSRFFMKKRGQKGDNTDSNITINWHDYTETKSRIIYYGNGTRNEYRLTRFGRGFPFLNDENVGDLLIIIPEKIYEYYSAFVLHMENEIDDFLNNFNLSPIDTNQVITLELQSTASNLFDIIHPIIENLTDFPNTEDMAKIARKVAGQYHPSKGSICSQKVTSDSQLVCWLFVEYEIFQSIENKIYKKYTIKPFPTVKELVKTANSILNKRKSRAGRALEHHLRHLFMDHNLNFTWQATTEGRKKPDFIFPEVKYYFDDRYREKLIFSELNLPVKIVGDKYSMKRIEFH